MRSTAFVNSKGQIVIPAELRKIHQLVDGTALVFLEERGRLVLELQNFAALYALQRSLEGFPLETSLEEERRAARECENDR